MAIDMVISLKIKLITPEADINGENSMRIKCIDNRTSILPESILSFYGSYPNASLIIDKSYLVYTMDEQDGITWFCIVDEEYSAPRWHPNLFFEVSDPRLSKYWICNFWNDSQDISHFVLGFPEWTNNKYFYTDLIESEEDVWEIFLKYEKLMYVEFPDPAVVEKAQIGDEDWLICPLCIDAWKSNTQDALVTRPKCKTVLNNPRYKNELPSYK
jgi:hypothetical protein